MAFLGGERIALLEKIDEFGSISKAAKSIGVSYKTAWDTINTINDMAEKPLFIRVTGGKSGGGTRLTEEGKDLIRTYRIIEEEHEKFLTNLEDKMGDVDEHSLEKLIKKLSKQASARNIFAGTIEKVIPGETRSEVTLTMKHGETIVAIITNESVRSLGLQKGSDAYAIVKAGSVIIGIGKQKMKVSIRNKLPGKIVSVTPGAVNSEVKVEMAGENIISAIITNECATDLSLKSGDPVWAMFKASSVIMGVG
jgi:molybdate transport system regulatory protein